MTFTQVLLLILVLLAVAAFAYVLGRNSKTTGTSEATPDAPQVSPRARPDMVPDTPAKSATPPPRSSPQMPKAAARPPVAKSGQRVQVASWGYQLQKLNIAQAAASAFDLLVIDPSKDGDDESALTPSELARLKQKPDGQRRLVLAYLSIGEAESYRGYWQAAWKKNKPSWLLKENPEWEENYAVCFWDPGWQAIMCGSPQARLDRILAAGFDGVYLDKCDVYEDMRTHRMPEAKARPDLEADMTSFVMRLSGYAKQRNPDFMVIMQNTEGLLDRPDLRRVLDGVAKEELVYGVESPEKKNSREDFEYSRDQLNLMQRDGKLVLVVEYLNTPAKIDDAIRTIAPLGYTLTISPKNRDLAVLPTSPPLIA